MLSNPLGTIGEMYARSGRSLVEQWFEFSESTAKGKETA